MWWASSAGVRTSDSSTKSMSSAWSTWASTKWPMRHLAITGIDHGLLDARDHRGVAHAGDAAVGPDVGGDALERHHGAGARLLGDAGLLGGGDVHDDAALQHLGQPRLDAHRPGAPVALGHEVPFSVGSEWESLPDPSAAPPRARRARPRIRGHARAGCRQRGQAPGGPTGRGESAPPLLSPASRRGAWTASPRGPWSSPGQGWMQPMAPAPSGGRLWIEPDGRAV